MTKEQIDRAIKRGKAVALSGDAQSRVCYDLFGNLVVVSLTADEPIRLATEDDMKRADIIFG
jgi:transcriptional/translational regulatory protein YebC/TACO1